MTEPVLAYVYVRVADAGAPPSAAQLQQRDCEAYAQHHGLTVTRVYQERGAIPKAAEGRPQAASPVIRQLVEDANREGVRALVIREPSRLGRTGNLLQANHQLLRTAAIKVYGGPTDEPLVEALNLAGPF